MQLPRLFKTPAVAIIGNTCYTSLVEQLNYRDAPCIKLAISKGLGYGIVAGGAVIKMPQIAKILRTRSAQGLSLSSYLLETLACVIGLAYNIRQGHSFSTYGETFFVAIQNLIILGLMLHYTGKPTSFFIILVTFLLSCVILATTVQDNEAAVTSFFITENTLIFLQKSVIPITLLSKILQIVENYSNKSTGQLSAFLIFNYFAGSLARVYTTLTEVKDTIILSGFLLSTALNCVLTFQVALYWHNNGTQPFKSREAGDPISSRTKTKSKKRD